VLDLIPPLASGDDPAKDQNGTATAARPDLIYVSAPTRKGLSIQFIEVKHRRHLRAARTPDLLEAIRKQVQSLRGRWDKWYSNEAGCASFRVVRRAKLARMLRFYADKAHRHYLATERYENIVSEIDRMIEKGDAYAFPVTGDADKGWVFCPEFTGTAPLEISPAGWDVRVFLFGPSSLPDSGSRSGELMIGGTVDANPKLVSAKSESSAVATESNAPESTAEMESGLLSKGKGDRNVKAQGPDSSDDSQASVCLGTDLLTGSEVRWPVTIKGNPHLLVAGLPGMGKTTCLLNLCKQMLDSNIRPIVFSYHQDIDERLQQLVSKVRFIDFHGLDFNPLQVIDRKSRMGHLDVAGALRDIFSAIYPEIGDIQGERIRKAVKESFIEHGWEDQSAEIANLIEPPFRRFLDILRADPKPDRGLRALLGRLEELDDYGFFNINESSESLWESENPTVIRIHTTQNDNLQKAFASLIFYGLYKDMFRRGIQDRITHSVIFDEAHRAARLRLVPTMAKECRKYGISLVLASQEAKDFNISLFSAIANYLVLRLNETDAKALVRNVSSSDQERTLVDRIKQLERFKALYFCEGKRKPSYLMLPS
jgi:DNA phosphorothioation-dependent restriction protein DptH